MHRLTPQSAGRLMIAVGLFGVVASVLGTIIGRQLVAEIHAGVGRSLALTTQSLTAIDASLEVAEEVVALVDQGIADVDLATREATESMAGGEVLLANAAELTRTDIADGIESVNGAMPALIQVSAAIDRSLAALSVLPLGIPYDPDQPFDQSVREIRDGLQGLPEELRAQADLLDEAAASMGEVGGRMDTIAEDLTAINEGLAEARVVLGGYAATASGARDLVEQAERDLGRQSRLAQIMVVALGLTIALGQIVPLYVGWELIQRPEVVEPPADDG